jgi:hypothetical protein
MAGWEKSTESSFSFAQQWSELIGPIRWYRAVDFGGAATFLYLVEGDASGYPDVGDDEMDWRPAERWSSGWEFSSTLWDPALIAPDQVATTTDESSTVEERVEPTAPERLEGTRLADPVVVSTATPMYAPRGAYAWPVRFTVGETVDQWSWIIQKVDFDDGEDQATFWEAFPVAAGAAQSSNEDSYQGGPSRLAGGTVKVRGLAQHHRFTTELPPGMSYGGAELSDSQQVASDAQPAFWLEDAGAAHDLTFEWTTAEGEGSLTSFTTVPATGAPTYKDDHRKFGVG